MYRRAAQMIREATAPVLLLLLGAVVVSTCGGPTPPASRHNVILVFFDALRADHLGCYGYDRDTSPTIDRLAAGGVLLGPAIAPCPVTYPSVPAILTSRAGSWFYDAGACILEPKYVTLAEILREDGYRTVAVSSSPIVTAGRSSYSFGGFDQGFDHFDDSWAEGGKINWQWRSPEGVVGAALEWLERREQGPFFMLLYIEDPHDVYRCPEPYTSRYHGAYSGPPAVEAGDVTHFEEAALDGRPTGLGEEDIAHLVALYDGEIRYADAQLGRLVERLVDLRLFDDTLLVVTSDHGEEFADHGGFKHGYALYDEAIRVPLVISWPRRLAPGTVVDEPLVASIDLLPTILELVGAPIPGHLEGTSLVPLIAGESVRWRRYALCEAEYADAKAVVGREWKLVHHFETYEARANLAPRYRSGSELYHIADDPEERHNVIDEHPEVARRLLAEMLSLLPPKERERLEARRPLTIPDDVVERLRSLGYLR